MSQSEDNIIPLSFPGRSAAHEERELLAILFTDLVDSTQLQTDFGDAESVRLMELHRKIVRQGLEIYNGREIDWAGDSCLAAFAKPSDAVMFAVTLQAGHRRATESEPRLPRVRVGIHLGEIVVKKLERGGRESEDLFGLQVSEASRVMSLARGNQIYCTRAVFDSARSSLRGRSRIGGCGKLKWATYGFFELKGSPEPLDICEVGEKDFAPLVPPETNDKCWPAPVVEAIPPEPQSRRFWKLMGATLATVVVLAVIFIAVLQPFDSESPSRPSMESTETTPDEAVAVETPSVRRIPILLPESAPVAPADSVLNFNLAMAPDGKRLVYRSLVGAEARLILRELDQLGVRPLPGTEGARYPFFSPDSRWVGYFAAPEQKLKKVSVDGGAPITLCDAFFYAGADWGDDGYIVFSNGGQGLMRVSSDGGTAERLSTPDPEKGETFHSHPSVLPGGKAILFNVASAIDIAQTTTALLFRETGEYTVFEGSGGVPRYVPSGHVLYLKPGALIAQAFDIERLEFVGSPAPVTEYAMIGSDGAARHFGFSKDGTLAYVPDYGAERESIQLVWVGLDGAISQTSVLPKGYVVPRVSPDGRRVAVSTLEAVAQDIWICDLEGDDAMRLTFDPAEDWHPVWTPDGGHIVFTSSRDGIFNLYMRATDGSGSVQRLTESPNPQWPHTWARDGKDLVYVERSVDDTGYDIWTMPLDDTSAARPVLQTVANENNPDMSADGRWIAYQSNESGQNEIYIQPFPDLTSKWQVSKSGGNQPRWSPDGTALYFRHGIQLLKAAVQTDPTLSIGVPEVLFENDSIILGPEARNYDISADGTQFLMLKFVQNQSGSALNRELIIVENWFEELKRLAPPSAN